MNKLFFILFLSIFTTIGFGTNQIFAQTDEVICTTAYTQYNCTKWKYYRNITGIKNSNGYWGLYSETGRQLVYPAYDSLEAFASSYIKTERFGNYGLINERGDIVLEPIYESISEYHSNFKIKRRNKYGIINPYGKIIISINYDDISYFDNYSYMVQKNGKYGILSNTETIIIPIEYKEITNGLDNQYIVNKNNQYGVINRNGTMVLDTIFDSVSTLPYKFYLVKYNGKYGIYNAFGKNLVPCKYFNNIIEMHYGNEATNCYYLTNIGGNSIQVLDITGKELGIINYEIKDMIDSTLFRLTSNHKYGIADINGNIYLQPIYDKIENKTFNGIRKVKLKGKWGAVDYTGKIIIPCSYGPIQITNEIKNYTVSTEHYLQMKNFKKTSDRNKTNVLKYVTMNIVINIFKCYS